MRYLPIQLSLRDRTVVVVGGGEVAARKAAVVAQAGARLHVVAPEVEAAFASWLAADGLHQVSLRRFLPSDVDGATLVVAATDNMVVNRGVSEAAQAAAIPVNVVDAPALCTFIMPALVDRSPLTVAVSSAGAAPVLARTVRARIEALLPARLGDLAELLGGYRDQVKARFDTLVARRAFWESVVEGPVAERVFAGDLDGARAMLAARLADPAGARDKVAFLVAAGPGDPDLLTLRAQRCLQLAERIYHAQDVPGVVLDHARRDAPRQPLPADVGPDALAEQLTAHLAASDRACWVLAGALGSRERAVAAALAAEGYQVTLAAGVAEAAAVTNR